MSRRTMSFVSVACVAALVHLYLVSTTHGAKSNATAAAAPASGKIDDAILKAVNEETRLNFLATKISDLNIHLPPDKAFGFTNSNAVHDAAGRVARGMQGRDKFLAEAPKQLDKRRKEVEQVYGDKLAQAQDLVKKPHNQSELFLLLLTDTVQQLNLPADQGKPRVLLGKRLQKLYDEDAKRRGGKGGAEPDAGWLEQYEQDVEKELLTALKTEQQKEVVRTWPAVFPDGPKPPVASE